MANIETKLQCQIHDQAYREEDVRKNICVNEEPLLEHSDGKHYCLFHLPTEEKDKVKFERIFRARLKAVKDKIGEIERNPSETEQKAAKAKVAYDFRYVWFPESVQLWKHEFVARVDFSYATFAVRADFQGAIFTSDAGFTKTTFCNEANFDNAKFSETASFTLATFTYWAYFNGTIFKHINFHKTTFSSQANFFGTKFLQKADFTESNFSYWTNFVSAIFKDEANFNSATFSNNVSFESATFSALAIFANATFSAPIDYKWTIFSNNVSFDSAIFDEKSEIFFNQTFFSNLLSFDYASIKGYIAFEGSYKNRLFIGENARISLENARIANAERISFHIVRLEPNWFINIVANDFVFTDCQWQYQNGKALNVRTELQNLKERNIENPNPHLTKACWHLSENHEESKSFIKASFFRQMANESKRLEELSGRKIWSLHWWYWLSSFYGESWKRAFAVLLAMMFGFALIYTQVDFLNYPKDKSFSETAKECKEKFESYCQKTGLEISEAVRHSLATATFQNVEYRKPVSDWSETWIMLEKIFVPIQAALLALAIRRKFMR